MNLNKMSAFRKGLLVMAIGVGGQVSSTQPQDRLSNKAPEAVMTVRQMQSSFEGASKPAGGSNGRAFIVGKGVEIRIGASILTADEAEISLSPIGEPSDVLLKGVVRLKSTITIKQPD